MAHSHTPSRTGVLLLAIFVLCTGCVANGARAEGSRSPGPADAGLRSAPYSVKGFSESRGLSGPILLDAYYVDAFQCQPCSDLCQPCVAVTILADHPNDPKETQLWIYGYHPELVKGRRYRFVLDLSPRYEDDFLLQTNNPQEKEPKVWVREFRPL